MNQQIFVQMLFTESSEWTNKLKWFRFRLLLKRKRTILEKLVVRYSVTKQTNCRWKKLCFSSYSCCFSLTCLFLTLVPCFSAVLHVFERNYSKRVAPCLYLCFSPLCFMCETLYIVNACVCVCVSGSSVLSRWLRESHRKFNPIRWIHASPSA